MTIQPSPSSNVHPVEGALLGACLLSRDAVDAALAVGVGSADFPSLRAAVVWEAITELHRAEAAVDPITVGEHLAHRGLLRSVGGAEFMLELAAATPAIASAARYAHMLKAGA